METMNEGPDTGGAVPRRAREYTRVVEALLDGLHRVGDFFGIHTVGPRPKRALMTLMDWWLEGFEDGVVPQQSDIQRQMQAAAKKEAWR